jgi:hypothetical protein
MEVSYQRSQLQPGQKEPNTPHKPDIWWYHFQTPVCNRLLFRPRKAAQKTKQKTPGNSPKLSDEGQHPSPQNTEYQPWEETGTEKPPVISTNTWIECQRNKFITFAQWTVLFVVVVFFLFFFNLVPFLFYLAFKILQLLFSYLFSYPLTFSHFPVLQSIILLPTILSAPFHPLFPLTSPPHLCLSLPLKKKIMAKFINLFI